MSYLYYNSSEEPFIVQTWSIVRNINPEITQLRLTVIAVLIHHLQNKLVEILSCLFICRSHFNLYKKNLYVMESYAETICFIVRVLRIL